MQSKKIMNMQKQEKKKDYAKVQILGFLKEKTIHILANRKNYANKMKLNIQMLKHVDFSDLLNSHKHT